MANLDFVSDDYVFVSSTREEVLSEIDIRKANRQIRDIYVDQLKFSNGLIIDGERYGFRETAFKSFLGIIQFSYSSASHMDDTLLESNINYLLSNKDNLIKLIIDTDSNEIRGVTTNDIYYGEELCLSSVIGMNKKDILVKGVLSDNGCRLAFANPDDKIDARENDPYTISYDIYFHDCNARYNFSCYLTQLSSLGGIVTSVFPGARRHCSLKSIEDIDALGNKMEAMMEYDYGRHRKQLEELFSKMGDIGAKEIEDYAIFKRQVKRLFGDVWKDSKLAKAKQNADKITYTYNDNISDYTFLTEIIRCGQEYSDSNPDTNYKGERIAGQVLTQTAKAYNISQ